MDLEEGGRGVEWLRALSPGAGPSCESRLCLSDELDDSLDPERDTGTLEVDEEVLACVVALDV